APCISVTSTSYISSPHPFPTRRSSDLRTCDKWKDPRQRRFAFRCLFKRGRVIEQRCIPCPLRFKFASGKLSQATRRVGHAGELLIDVVEHDPVISFPMRNGWQRH